MDNFQKTVNLKDKAEKERQRMLYGEPEKIEKKIKSKAEGIDEVYRPTINVNVNNDNDLRQISKPEINNDYSPVYKKVAFAVAIILFLVAGYFLFFRGGNGKTPENNQGENWYSVKLQNGEVYYGQIIDTKSDPVVIKNVYYDYDLINKTENKDQTTGSLRLVKKGKETYGPAGVMEVVRSNVLYMDQLKSDSKVLRAILDYENKNAK